MDFNLYPEVNISYRTNYDNFSAKESNATPCGNVRPSLKLEFPLLHPVWQRVPEAPYGVQVLIGFVALTVGLVGLVGNLMVIYLFIRSFRKLRSANLLVLNLAIGDSLLVLTNVPLLVISSFRAKWMGGVVGCRLFAFCGGLSGFVSINTLAVLAVERCIVITYNMPNTHRLSKRGVFCLCIGIWMYSFLWSIPPYLGWGDHMMEGSRTSCTFDYFTRTTNNRSYVLSILVFCFIIQLIVIVVSYVKIIQQVFEHQKEIVHCHHKTKERQFCLRIASKNKNNINIEWKTTKTVFVLVLIYCISWLPYATISVIGQFFDTSLVTPVSSALPAIFAKMSSFLNPLFYTLIHSKYRKMILSKCRFWRKLPGVNRNMDPTTERNHSFISNSDIDCKHFKVVLAVNIKSSHTHSTSV